MYDDPTMAVRDKASSGIPDTVITFHCRASLTSLFSQPWISTTCYWIALILRCNTRIKMFYLETNFYSLLYAVTTEKATAM